MAALHQQDRVAAEDEGPYAEDGPGGIAPIVANVAPPGARPGIGASEAILRPAQRERISTQSGLNAADADFAGASDRTAAAVR